MKPSHLESIGKNVRLMREHRKMTGEQLADLAGILKSDVSKIENGKRNITINTLVRIASALNCSIDIIWRPL